MLYVYGVVRPGHPPPDQPGVGQPPLPVRTLDGDGLAALVSDVDGELTVGEADARAHLELLTAALADGPVIPLRLGTMLPDEADVHRELLGAAAAELQGALAALDGMVELQVDVDDDEGEALAAIGNAVPGLRARSADIGDRIEVGRQIGQLLVERRSAMAEQIIGRLRPFAVDDVPRSVISGPEDPVLRWAFLVRRNEVENFDEGVIALRSEFPTLSVRYVGPVPAAHFIARSVPSSADATTTADNFRGDGSWGW